MKTLLVTTPTPATLEDVRRVVDQRMPDGHGVDQMRRATIIVGAGLHLQGGLKNTPLGSWDGLLQKINVERHPNSTYTTAFETALREHAARDGSPRFAPHRAEAKLQKTVQEELAKATKEIGNPDDIYKRLLHAGYLDIINLNFDQLLCREHVRLDAVPKQTERTDRKGTAGPSIALKRWYAHRRLKDSETRIWHPHGWVERRDSIVLGRHQYAATLAEGPRLFREQEKRHARAQNAAQGGAVRGAKDDVDAVFAMYMRARPQSTWLSAFLAPRPVVIIGASVGHDELDLLWALSLRARRNHRDPDSAPTYHILAAEGEREGGRKPMCGHRTASTYGLVREVYVEHWSEAWSVVAPKA